MQKCYINYMALRKKNIRAEELGADFLGDGVSVSPDWRYDVLMDYLRASHSFQAVLKSELGKKSKYRLPVDFDVVNRIQLSVMNFVVKCAKHVRLQQEAVTA